MMSFAGRLDELPRPIWVALAILAFVFWWPLGLAIFGCMLWSGTMGCCGFGFGHWNERVDRAPETRGWSGQQQPSGNRAFEEYRAQTLRRLEEEQREFQEFLALLHSAKDKAEFDQFMATQRSRPGPPASQTQT